MLIKKENKDSITCRISKEELTARGITSMEDLLRDQVQAKKFLNEILDEARETVHFTTDSAMINVQMAGLADGSVSIKIFADKQSAMRSMLEKYKDIVKLIGEPDEAKDEKPADSDTADSSESPKDPYEGVEIDTIAPRFDGKQSITSLTAEEAQKLLGSTSEDEPVHLPVAVSFGNLQDAIGLCRQIRVTNSGAASDLYKLDGRYYLTAALTDTKRTLGNTIFAISEYSGRIENHGDVRAVLEEHGEVISRGNAIEALGSL